MTKCNECGEILVSCDKLGNTRGTGFKVCPLALQEQRPEEFKHPWRRRLHKNAHIMEDPKHVQQQRAAAAALQVPMFDPDTGKRVRTAK